MITDAKDRPITSAAGTLPDVSSALLDYFQEMTFVRIAKTMDTFKVVETETEVSMMGVRQPLSAQQLQQKPEGQRAWRWEMIHAEIGVELVPDEIIKIDGQKFRVMAKWGWKEYGYIEYHICSGYTT